MATALESLVSWWQDSPQGQEHARRAATERADRTQTTRRELRERLADLQSKHAAALPKLNAAVSAEEGKVEAAKRVLATAAEKLDAAKVDRHNCVVRFDLESDRLRGEIAAMPENAIVEFETWIEAEIQVLRKRKGSETSSEAITNMEGRRTGERVVATDFYSVQRRMMALAAARQEAADLRYVVCSDLEAKIVALKTAIPEVMLEPIEQPKNIVARIRGMVAL